MCIRDRYGVVTEEGVAGPFFAAFYAFKEIVAGADGRDTAQQGDGGYDVCVNLLAEGD